MWEKEIKVSLKLVLMNDMHVSNVDADMGIVFGNNYSSDNYNLSESHKKMQELAMKNWDP